jgi:hypothetical protein
MKKVIIALALVATLVSVSCKNHDTAETTGTDSTAVAVDSAKVDTTTVKTDTTTVAKDTVK